MMREYWINFVTVIGLFLFFSEVGSQSDRPPQRTGVRGWLYTRNPAYIKFLLFPNSDNEDYYEEIFLGNKTSLERSQFIKGKSVILLLHGLLGHANIITDIQQVKNAYLSVRENANVIIGDYRELAGAHFPLVLSWLTGILSLPANLNVNVVGTRVAEFILFLINEGAIRSPNDVHIVGHSLGCHVGGRAGTIVTNKIGMKVGRISGLDCPGGQIFPILLKKSDATFVDVTRTSFKILGSIGHVDFFMNAAFTSQPVCPNALLITDSWYAPPQRTWSPGLVAAITCWLQRRTPAPPCSLRGRVPTIYFYKQILTAHMPHPCFIFPSPFEINTYLGANVSLGTGTALGPRNALPQLDMDTLRIQQSAAAIMSTFLQK